jgi:glycerophosphoryl diester phosphodiesterase
MFFDNLPEGSFVCAHRGARSIAPENTLLSMRRARECEAHCWETDVRLSRDGELIIFHDPTLESTTDIAIHKAYKDRRPWATDQFTAAELRGLDAGSWFLRDDPFGTIASGEVSPQEQEAIRGQKIPLLHEVLEFTGKHHFPVNLEIKDLETPQGDVLIVDKIMDMLEQTGTMDLVLLSSFRYEYLYRARELHPAISLAVLAGEQHPADLLRKLSEFSATAYHPKETLCDPDLIRELQRANFRINPWTVNNIAQAKKMLQDRMGVITDWPQRLTGIKAGSTAG